MGPDSPRSEPEACFYVADWANRVQGFIAALPQGESDRLAEWMAAFAFLEEEAKACLNSARMGASHPEAVDRLVKLAQRTGLAFAKALDIPIDGVAEVSESEPKPEPAPTPKPVPGRHVLPPLPYAYDALEPYIDEETMRLHHDKHHKAYVDGLNKAEQEMDKARETGDYSLIKHWEREAAFNGAGHYLHTIFWTNMSPGGRGTPTGALIEQIHRDFGDFKRFHDHFAAAAEKVEGGGWAILVWAPQAGKLEILQAEKHQNLSQWDVSPLLVLDVWEHAYYLKHQNDRKAYIANWWNVVNWADVARRFEQETSRKR